MLARTEQRTPAQIAASVKRTAEHEQAEERFAQARTRRNAVHEQMIAMIAKNKSGQYDRAVNELSAEVDGLEAEVNRLRAEVRPRRETHGAAVAAALADLRRQDAETMIDAIETASATLARLDETNILIESAGGECIRFPAPSLQFAMATAKRIAGR